MNPELTELREEVEGKKKSLIFILKKKSKI